MHPTWRFGRRRPVLDTPGPLSIAPGRKAALRGDGDRRRQVAVEPTLGSVAVARTFISSVVGTAAPHQAESAAACGSELVANAVVHGLPPILLVVVTRQGHVVVAVEDASRRPPAPRLSGPTDPGGRGTLIVERLADRWGVDFLPDGKRVWCLLAAQPP